MASYLTDQELGRLAARVGRELARAGLKLASAESCTGGWIGQAVTSVTGSSAWYDCGFITYSNEAKTEMLGVPAGVLAQHGAVSEATVRAMAEGALRNSRAQAAVAITGVAGPDGGTAEKPVGTVWFGWALKGGATRAERHRLDGDREAVRRQSVAIALQGLLDLAAGQRGSGD